MGMKHFLLKIYGRCCERPTFLAGTRKIFSSPKKMSSIKILSTLEAVGVLDEMAHWKDRFVCAHERPLNLVLAFATQSWDLECVQYGVYAYLKRIDFDSRTRKEREVVRYGSKTAVPQRSVIALSQLS